MMPYRDSVEVDGVPVPCHVGMPYAGLPATTDSGQVINTDRLLVLAAPGSLPPSVTAGADPLPAVVYQGKTWRPATVQVTHRRHGVDHHVSVQITRITA